MSLQKGYVISNEGFRREKSCISLKAKYPILKQTACCIKKARDVYIKRQFYALGFTKQFVKE